MTATSPAITWAAHPLGKATRLVIAVTGMVMATLVLMLAVVASSGSWMLVVLGLALGAQSVRTALTPNTVQLSTLALVTIAIPLSLRFL